jgi:uncharacterized protein (UPF0335 family)
MIKAKKRAPAAQPIDPAKLKGYVERIEAVETRLVEERDARADIYTEVKASGMKPKMVRRIIKERAKKDEDAAEAAELDAYLQERCREDRHAQEHASPACPTSEKWDTRPYRPRHHRTRRKRQPAPVQERWRGYRDTGCGPGPTREPAGGCDSRGRVRHANLKRRARGWHHSRDALPGVSSFRLGPTRAGCAHRYRGQGWGARTCRRCVDTPYRRSRHPRLPAPRCFQ